MKHLRKFSSVTAMNTALASATINILGLAYNNGTPVMKIKSGGSPVPPAPDPTEPFYIDVRGAVTLAATSGLQMSTDGKNWTDTVAGDLPIGKTYFRVASDGTYPLKPNWTEDSNSDYDIGGNINSLVKTVFEDHTTCYSFTSYFANKAKLKNAGNLILPATTLVGYCYQYMFQGCTSLTTAPELPATTLATQCYQYMFQGCTSLTTAPELPATTLATYCYAYMFQNCTSLTTAPELPATTLTSNCYIYMFKSCTALTTAPALPATTLANSCYAYMFQSCTALTTAPELPATLTSTNYDCYKSMFQSCTALTTAPTLPSTTLAQGCYYQMFNRCTGLTTAPELPATTLTATCYYEMFKGCTNLNYIKCLATNKSATNCTKDWVNGVSSTGTFIKNQNMSSWTTDVNGIPSGWTVQDASE